MLDVVCCLTDFRLKEDILKAVWLDGLVSYEDTDISIYQDLFLITLQTRHSLRPLLLAPWDRNIPYKFCFPIALSATNAGIKLFYGICQIFWCSASTWVYHRWTYWNGVPCSH